LRGFVETVFTSRVGEVNHIAILLSRRLPSTIPAESLSQNRTKECPEIVLSTTLKKTAYNFIFWVGVWR
jgi:hypothetical protein